MATCQQVKPQKCGPYGTQLAQNYSLMLKQGESIKEVIVRHGFIVDAIGFVVADKCGRTTKTIFGGERGNESKLALKNGEHITQISGTYGEYMYMGWNCLVATLKIHTNLTPSGYGPFGRGECVRNARSFASPVGQIVGVFGKHNNYLESVGAYLLNTPAPAPAPAPTPTPTPAPTPKPQAVSQNWSLMLEKGQRVKQLVITNGFIVDAIEFVIADACGKTFTKKFGGNKGGDATQVDLKPNEYITRITGNQGQYAHDNGRRVICEMKVHTNLCPDGYGIFGLGVDVKNLTSFSSPPPPNSDRPATGFFGRAGDFLEYIAIYNN